MRKRTLISIVITIFILIVSNRYWLIFKPFYVGLDMQGKGKYSIEIKLNKKNDDNFKKFSSTSRYIDLYNKGYFEFLIGRIKYPKKLQIVISEIPNDNSIIIKDIYLKNNKIKIDNYEKFKAEGANITYNKEKLVLKPTSSKVILTYSEKLNTRTSTEFDFKLFVIILILSYLFIYKLSDYTADFNSIDKKSKTEIIFLSIFFIFLFIPMSNINKNEISERENRILAKWKPLILENYEINFNFGKDFEKWFGDRFFLRKEMVNFYYTFLSYFSNDYYESKYVIYNKKADFAFNKYYDSVNMYLKNNLFSDNELNQINKNLSNLQKYCNKNNVKLFIFLSNDKESIYPEFYPKFYQPLKNQSRLEEFKEAVKNTQNISIVSPTEVLLQEKKKQAVFLPYDTHLNGYGSYIEYNLLINKIKEKYPYITPLLFSDIQIVKLDSKGDSLPPKRYINKKFEFSDKIKVKNPHSKLEYKLNSVKAYKNMYADNNLKVVIIGDSFHARYTELLAENFYSLKSMFVGGGLNYKLSDTDKKTIFSEKPDILIIESTERFLQRFLELDSFLDVFDSVIRNN